MVVRDWLRGISVFGGLEFGEGNEPVASLEGFERAGYGYGVGVEELVEREFCGEEGEGGGEVGFEVGC